MFCGRVKINLRGVKNHVSETEQCACVLVCLCACVLVCLCACVLVCLCVCVLACVFGGCRRLWVMVEAERRGCVFGGCRRLWVMVDHPSLLRCVCRLPHGPSIALRGGCVCVWCGGFSLIDMALKQIQQE